jgi:hypothetical protein
MFETHLLLLMKLKEGVAGQGLISLAGLPYNVTSRYRKITGFLKLVHLYIAQSSRYVK